MAEILIWHLWNLPRVESLLCHVTSKGHSMYILPERGDVPCISQPAFEAPLHLELRVKGKIKRRRHLQKGEIIQRKVKTNLTSSGRCENLFYTLWELLEQRHISMKYQFELFIISWEFCELNSKCKKGLKGAYNRCVYHYLDTHWGW